MKPITKVKWEKFSGKERWDCIVALRGPDCTNPGLMKWFTTAVIRWRMSQVMRIGGMVNDALGCIIIPELALPITSPFSLAHFIQHTWEAAVNLDIPILRVDLSTWEKALRPTKEKVSAGIEFYRAISKLPLTYGGTELRRHLVEDYNLGMSVEKIDKEEESA